MEEKILRKMKKQIIILTVCTVVLSLTVLALAGVLFYEKIIYNSALSHLKNGNIEKAETLLASIPDYKDADELLASLEYRKIGNKITFGSYEQDGNRDNGGETLSWIVLDYDAENEKALIITEKCIDQAQYKTEYGAVSWETSVLRQMLNSRFLERNFTAAERERILVTKVETPDNATYGTKGGNATEDKVFCLSDREFRKYLAGTENAIGYVTDYAASRGVISGPISGTSMCWLRTAGESLVYVSTITYEGEINSMGIYPFSASCGIRPAMWISVSE